MTKQIKTIADLTPDDKNANRGTQRGLGMLDNSLRQYGAGRSIVVDKNGKVIGGNKTLERAFELGMEIETVRTSGDRLVVVIREDLDLDKDPKARELAYADNRVGEVSLDWDLEQLAIDLQEGVDLSSFFTDEEIQLKLEGYGDELSDRGDDGRGSGRTTLSQHTCPKCGHKF